VKGCAREHRGITVFFSFFSTSWIDPPSIANYQNNRSLCHGQQIRLKFRDLRHKNESLREAQWAMRPALLVVLQRPQRVRFGDCAEQTLGTVGRHHRKALIVMTGKALKYRGQKLIRPREGNFSRIMSRAMITSARSGFVRNR
jgi:hypothetical protein